MSIFDRFRAPAKKIGLKPAVAARGATPATPATSTVDRRHRARKNARQGVSALIIDDSPTVVAVLRKILRSAGYTTREALDAEHGLALIAQEQPDLIFLDIVLPGMNGFGALRAIRKDPLTQHIPVIMISGNEHATEQFYANRIGADDFMKKPFSRFEVFAHIELLLDAHRLPRRKGGPELRPEAAGTSVKDAMRQPTPLPQPVAAPTEPMPVDVSLLALSALHARKELTAMGLQYFDQAQFFAAIQRSDHLAVELFVAGCGLALATPMNGKTALNLAQEQSNENIVRLISQAQPL